MILVGFYGVFWRKAGQTLGMQTWRLKTMNRDGSLLSWGKAVKRILAACVLPALCGGLGFFDSSYFRGDLSEYVYGFAV